MSLLLEALQKASKNHLDETSITAAAPSKHVADFTLEPLTDPQPGTSGGSASPEAVTPASPEYAAGVMHANDAPRYSILDWMRDHYMLSFVASAVLFAIVYGLYVYIQIANPSILRSSPPQVTAPIQAIAVTPARETASRTARISGLPTAGTREATSDRTNTAGVSDAGEMLSRNDAESVTPDAGNTKSQRIEADTTASRTKPAAQVERATRSSQAVAGGKPATRLANNNDGVETVAIPASPTPPAGGEEKNVAGKNIWVKQQDTTVSPIDTMLLEAYEAMQSGQYEHATSLYSNVQARDPDNIDALLGLAAISWKQGRTNATSQYYGRVLELEPRNSYAQAGLIALLGNAEPVAAESKLKQLIGREPSGFLYFTLGNLYAEQGKWSRAQDAFFQAYQFDSDNPDYAFNLAVGLEHLGKPRLALRYYRIALELSFAKGRANFDQRLAIERVGQLSARVD